MDTEDINSVGKIIGTLIFFIVIVIGILIIIDEIFHISKFCYKYTYLYNYGKLNENICKKDNNNLIEYETARYRICNEINKYKLEKDLFNKNWINYAVFVSILIISLLICLSFGYLFYYFFIANNKNCDMNENNKSFINLFLECLSIETKLPNCTFNYIILYTIIFIYPLIFILKFLFKIDYTFENKSIFLKILHFLIFISFCYYTFLLTQIKNDNEDYWNLNKITIFVIFIIVFYVANYLYNKAYEDYYNISKDTNIYSGNKTIVGILNKYFNFSINNQDDFRDINFFEIYKQEEPEKPIEPIKPDNYNSFKICQNFTDEKNKYCYNYKDNKEEYYKIKNSVEEYNEKKKIYDKEMKTYNMKYNIYKNNKLDFPEFVPILTNLLPNLLGANKTSHILLFILMIIIYIYYYHLKLYKKFEFANFVYYTILVYVISILSIYVLSNSILTYNTYVNKYLIYEPIAYYKEDLFNMDVLFNALLNKDSDKNKSDIYINIYNKINSKSFSTFNKITSPTSKSSKDIINKDPITYPTTINNDEDILNKLRCQILRVIFSDLIKIDSKSIDTTKIRNLQTFFNNINSDDNTDFFVTTGLNTNDFISSSLRTFLIIIKNIFVENPLGFDNHIQQLKNNLKHIIYENKLKNYSVSAFPDIQKFNDDFLIKDVSNNELLMIDNTKTSDYINIYMNNLNNINNIFEKYKEFLMLFREKIIKLFNSTEVYCEDGNSTININMKLNNYISKIFNFENNPEFRDFNTTNYFQNYKIKATDNEKDPKLEIYLKILKFYMEDINNILKKVIKIIKIIYILDFDKLSQQTSNKLEYNIINNYNFYNKDTKKHTKMNLDNNFEINLKNFENKFSFYDTDKNLKLNLSINNINWSFVIIIIIIAIFLLEPIIIQS